MNKNPDYVLSQLRKREAHWLRAAETQTPTYGEYAEECRDKAKFYRGVIDTIENLLTEIMHMRMRHET